MTTTKHVLISALAVVLCSLSVEAQTPRRFSRPRTRADRRPFISPYLNLLNSGRNFESQFFQRTLPELEFRRNNSALNFQLSGFQQQLTTQNQDLQNVQTTIGGTGHRTSFLNTGGYFLSSGALGGRRPNFSRPNIGRSSNIGTSSNARSNFSLSSGGRSSRR